MSILMVNNGVTGNSNNIILLFWRIVKIKFKNKHYRLFPLQAITSAHKNKVPHIIHFTNQYQMN
jgi:hypothetical protein